MNIAININDYNEENVYFNTPIKNTVIDNSDFIRTIYSNELITLNGIYLKIKFCFSHIERYFNKYKCNYDLDITDCIFYILNYLIENNKINSDNMNKLLCKTVSFLQYYNNNYRPIYHLESYIFYLISIIHGFNICM